MIITFGLFVIKGLLLFGVYNYSNEKGIKISDKTWVLLIFIPLGWLWFLLFISSQEDKINNQENIQDKIENQKTEMLINLLEKENEKQP